MRTEREIRDKVREIENSHTNLSWDAYGDLDREWKIRCRHEIRGLLYALGYNEEEIVPLHSGELDPRFYEIPQEPISIQLKTVVYCPANKCDKSISECSQCEYVGGISRENDGDYLRCFWVEK
jgi:hypothetical protein